MSDIAWEWLALGVTVILFAGLAVLSRKKLAGFGLRTIIASVLGIGVGLAFQGHTTYVAVAGSIWSNVIKAIVVPLLIFSIIASITNLGKSVRLKNIGLKSIVFLMINTLTAALLALGLGLAFNVGQGFSYQPDGSYEAREVPGVLDTIIGLFPSNLVGNWAQNQVIPVVVFSLIVAVAFNAAASTERGAQSVAPFKRFIDGGNVVMSKATQIVIGFTPYAVLALIASAISGSDIAVLLPLVWVLIVSYIAMAIQMFLVQPAILFGFTRLNPIIFFKAFWPAGVVAFTSESSIGTIPVTVTQLKKMGVKDDVASFVTSLGANLGMPGCAGIWPVIVAVFTINAQGLNYGPGQYLFLVALALLVSVGTVGVPGTATVTATSLFAAAGLPVEFIGVMQPISTIVDMGRTALNVAGAANSAVIVAKTEKQIDLDIYNGRKEYIEEDADLLAEAEALVSGRRASTAVRGGANAASTATVSVSTPTTAAGTTDGVSQVSTTVDTLERPTTEAGLDLDIDFTENVLSFSPSAALEGQGEDQCGFGPGESAPASDSSK